jgi:hypothetical protein
VLVCHQFLLDRNDFFCLESLADYVCCDLIMLLDMVLVQFITWPVGTLRTAMCGFPLFFDSKVAVQFVFALFWVCHCFVQEKELFSVCRVSTLKCEVKETLQIGSCRVCIICKKLVDLSKSGSAGGVPRDDCIRDSVLYRVKDLL